jgi:hypothetical protein
LVPQKLPQQPWEQPSLLKKQQWQMEQARE